MIDEDRLLTALAKLLKRTKADGASVCAHATVRRVFRFAYGAIHQSLVQEGVNVIVKVIRDRRVGIASADTLEPQGLSRCVRAAEQIARYSPPQEHLAPLPARHRLTATADHVPATLRVTPESLVGSLKRLFHLCQGAGASLAGSLVTGEDEFAVANSAGVRCYAASTVAGAKLVTMFGRLSGYASGVHRDVRRLDLDALLKRSLSQSLHRREPVTPPLGVYEVILEPEAVGELMAWLGSIAFGAKSLAERTSFLAGRLGERVCDRQLTIYDDGNDPSGLRMPFDFEGTPKQRTVLIDRGRAAGVVYDTAYGARFGRSSTGHALPYDETEGPLPLHLGLAPGRTTVARMIRACRRGLLIPRFHYVNGLLNPREALMTGLTREGAFLIEDGRVTAPVTTLRFTQGLLEAFSRVRGISRERRLVADPGQELGSAVLPTLHLAAFRFTGRSEHK
ncbi:MAG: TldD/PmbA family protein [Candidatus Omnitrophica bacterium]|nr:TldD/PmbA family protein [Candidatus Omnitrophota bacterium]